MYENPDIIGQIVEIIKSKNKYDENKKGLILYETKNMIHIQTNKKIIKLYKNNLILKINDKIIIGNTINNKIYIRKTLCK